MEPHTHDLQRVDEPRGNETYPTPARPSLWRRYLAWERRNVQPNAAAIVVAGGLYLATAPLLPWRTPGWAMWLIAVYAVAAALAAAIDVVQRAPAGRRRTVGLVAIGVAVLPASGALWWLAWRLMPEVVTAVRGWIDDNRPWIVPVGIVLLFLALFEGERRAKGATWRGLLDALRERRRG